MWKLYFQFSDGGKIIITGKGKGITQEQKEKYVKRYAVAYSAIYQEYPKKEHEPVKLW